MSFYQGLERASELSQGAEKSIQPHNTSASPHTKSSKRCGTRTSHPPGGKWQVGGQGGEGEGGEGGGEDGGGRCLIEQEMGMLTLCLLICETLSLPGRLRSLLRRQ